MKREKKIKILALYAQGKTYKEIGEIFGVSMQYISQMLAEWGAKNNALKVLREEQEEIKREFDLVNKVLKN